MKFACLLADGFEDMEALGTTALLRRAGFEIDFYSVFNHEQVVGSYKIVVTDLKKMEGLRASDYQGLFIPGGKASFVLRETESVKKIVKEFHSEDKWLLALCAAPTVYGMLGIMDGIEYTSFPSTAHEMGKAVRIEKKAVVDGKFITGMSAGSVYEFVFAVIEAIQGKAALKKFKENIVF